MVGWTPQQKKMHELQLQKIDKIGFNFLLHGARDFGWSKSACCGGEKEKGVHYFVCVRGTCHAAVFCSAIWLLTTLFYRALILAVPSEQGLPVTKIELPQCSADESAKQAAAFFKAVKASTKWQTWTKCPAPTILQRIYEADPSRNKTFVNVGANKGYNAASWLALWGSTAVNPQRWYQRIVKTHPEMNPDLGKGGCPECHPCGACKDCQEKFTALPGRAPPGNMEMHFLEPSNNNFKLLTELESHFRPEFKEVANMHVHHEASSNFNGFVEFPEYVLVHPHWMHSRAPMHTQPCTRALSVSRIHCLTSLS